MEIQATVTSNEVCVNATFQLNATHPRIGDVIVFGQLVTGFVVFARDGKMTVDIKTAVLQCDLSASNDANFQTGLWTVKSVLVADMR